MGGKVLVSTQESGGGGRVVGAGCPSNTSVLPYQSPVFCLGRLSHKDSGQLSDGLNVEKHTIEAEGETRFLHSHIQTPAFPNSGTVFMAGIHANTQAAVALPQPCPLPLPARFLGQMFATSLARKLEAWWLAEARA